MPTKIKETLSSLIMSGHDVWTARDALCLCCRSLVTSASGRGQLTALSQVFCGIFRLPLLRGETPPSYLYSMRFPMSPFSSNGRWKTWPRLSDGAIKVRNPFSFYWSLVKHDLNIRGKRCEKWIRKIRRAFGPRKDMSIVVMFVQGKNLVFSFAYHNGHTWQVTASPAVSCAENTEFPFAVLEFALARVG